MCTFLYSFPPYITFPLFYLLNCNKMDTTEKVFTALLYLPGNMPLFFIIIVTAYYASWWCRQMECEKLLKYLHIIKLILGPFFQDDCQNIITLEMEGLGKSPTCRLDSD